MSTARAGDVVITADGLSEEAISAILAERAQHAAAAPEEEAVATSLVLVCAIGQQRFGFAIADLWEVTAGLSITRVPGAPPALIGVFSRRGVVHNLFDPAALLGASPAAGAGAILIWRRQQPRLALRLDAALRLAPVKKSEQDFNDDALTRYVRAFDTDEGLSLVNGARLTEWLLAR